MQSWSSSTAEPYAGITNDPMHTTWLVSSVGTLYRGNMMVWSIVGPIVAYVGVPRMWGVVPPHPTHCRIPQGYGFHFYYGLHMFCSQKKARNTEKWINQNKSQS